MVVKDVQGLGGFPSRPVEVRKHLLDAIEVFPREEQDRNALLAKGRVFFQRLLDGRAPVLAVIDYEVGLEGHFKDAKLVVARNGGEGGLSVIGGSQRREEVSVFVLEDVPGNFGNSAFLNDPLGPLLRRELRPVLEFEELWDHSQ